MSTETENTSFTSPENEADCDAVIEHMLSRKPLDPAVYRRVRERSQRITEQIRRQHGLLDIAVNLVRETRDEE